MARQEILLESGTNEMELLTLCRKIKETPNLNEIPFIIFSSLINEQMVLKCKRVGADAYITKPETNRLLSILDEICQGHII